MRITILIILLCFLFIDVFGQFNNPSLQRKIPTPKVGSTSKTILESLVRNYNFLISYQSNDSVINYAVQLPKADSIMVQELLRILEQNLPYEFILKNEYIILKKKVMPRYFELEGTVKSKISDDNPVFANVSIKGTNIAQGTNQQGKYSLKLLPGNYEIEYSCVGYKTIKRDINLYANLIDNIILEREFYNIKEIEVRKTREKVMKVFETGRNIERIESKTIDQINYNNPTDALEGRINGVWATRVSGAPGDHQQIRIRGINSLFAAVDPLYVVNGVQIPVVNLNSLGIADINSRDIESITVLKDVASTAYYGYQGGNGVIKIETKKGGGKNQIHFNSRTGLQFMDKRYSLMNSSEFLQTMMAIDTVFPNRQKKFLRYDTYFNVNGIAIERNVYPKFVDTLAYIGTDWQNELFQKGEVQEYQITFQGSGKKINYYVSGNYFDHNGIVVNTNYKKYSYSANLGVEPFKNFTINLSGFGSVRKNENSLDNYLGNKVILAGINIEPNYDSLSYRERRRIQTTYNGAEYTMDRPKEMYAFVSSDMLDLYIDNLPFGRDFFSLRNQTIDVSSNNLGLDFNYQISPELSVNNRTSISLKEYAYQSLIKVDTTLRNMKYYKSAEEYRVMSNVFNINYSKKISDNLITLNATYRFYRDQVKWDVDSIFGFNLDALDKTTDGYIRGSNAVYGETGNVVRDINSLILHAKYSYKNKYTLSAFVNYDQLKEGNHVHAKELFPSIALSWDLSKENWLKSVELLNELSLYSNWGITGNYPLNSLSNDLYAKRLLSNEKEYEKGIYISNLANHALVPEEVEEVNLGLKVDAFQNRVSFSANYYLKENRNLIINRAIPYYYGGGRFLGNFARMHHYGLELMIDAYPVETDNLKWNTILGYAFDKQIVMDVYTGQDTLLFNKSQILIPDFYVAKNSRIGDIVGYKYEGIWTEKDDLLQDSNCVNRNGIKYYKKSRNGSGLSPDDKVVIGNSLPDFTCHWINSFQYKNLTVNMHWNAVVGVDKFNATRATTYFTQLNKEVRTFVENGQGHFMDPVFYESSYFVENASFVRLKNLSFVYKLKKQIFGKVQTSFTLSFENLITISPYKGYDPEATSYTDNSFSDNAIDMGAYPSPKSIFFGIDIIF